ncbi:hypothetical protein ACVGOW_02200 [Pseudonocardia saturnea]
MTTTSPSTTVDHLLGGIARGAVPAGLLTDDAVLDAVVPNWRFAVTGSRAVAAVYRRWFHRPVRVAELRRHPTAGGEVVEYTLNWVEDGRPHASRHVHVLHLAPDGRIAADHFWCGGIWPAPLLARMEAVARGAHTPASTIFQ